jgi:hypothetical protein
MRHTHFGASASGGARVLGTHAMLPSHGAVGNQLWSVTWRDAATAEGHHHTLRYVPL